MNTVADLLKIKGHNTWSMNPEASVYEALQLMAEKNIGAVLVLDEAGQLAGIFSERDYARKVVLKGKSSRGTLLKEVMTATVISVGPDQSIESCMELMTDKHVRHLPALNRGELIGLISIGDVVKSIISDQQFTISQLEGYITGKY